MERDRERLLPLPATPYEACERRTNPSEFPGAGADETNDDSVPVEYGHRQVLVKAFVWYDVATHAFRSTGVTGECATPWVFYGLGWRSPDGAKIYVGYGPPSPDNMAISNAFRVFDTDTWKQLGTAQTSIPFWSATMSVDGWSIYALAPRQHAILEIDAATLREKRKFSLGITPALAVVAP